MRSAASLVMLACLSMPAVADNDVFSDAKSGKYGCLDVRMQEKTCMMMYHYTWADDGSIAVEQSAIDASAPHGVATSVAMASIKGNSICHREFPPSTSDASYRPSVPGQSLLHLTAGQKQPDEFCLEFDSFADIYTVQLRLNGTQLTPYPLRWKWILPDEGYRLTDQEFFR